MTGFLTTGVAGGLSIAATAGGWDAGFAAALALASGADAAGREVEADALATATGPVVALAAAPGALAGTNAATGAAVGKGEDAAGAPGLATATPTPFAALAVAAGHGVAAIAALSVDSNAMTGLPALWRLTWSSLVLGATFLGAGYAISALSRRPSGAAGLAIGLWLVLIVLYDLGLLAAVVADNGGAFTLHVFPYALLANPADAFRLFNLSASQATAAAARVAGAAQTIPVWQSLASLLIWPILALGLATAAFRKVVP